MNIDTFQTESFKATIAYGWLALAGVIAAAIVRGSNGSVLFALAAAGAAYLSQSAATHSQTNPRLGTAALALQCASVLCFVISAVSL